MHSLVYLCWVATTREREREELALRQCSKCGYIFNSLFDFEKIKICYESQNYLSRKAISPKMNSLIERLSNEILSFSNDETIFLEIAPGSGDLAFALAKNARFLYTIDPSNVSLALQSLPNVKHILGFFDEHTIIEKQVDFVIFRHLLEHINKPYEFLNAVSKILKDKGIIYIEVPNFKEIANNHRFYEIFNDHCGYYQSGVLANFMANMGFNLIKEIYLFDLQHIGLFFQKSNVRKQNIEIDFYGEQFRIEFREVIVKFNENLKSFNNIGIYGAGAHGNSLVCFLENENLAKISCCFDLDSRKVGKFLSQSNIKIFNPESNKLNECDAIIVASPLYEDEICNFLSSKFNGEIIKTKSLNYLLESK